ncbi:amino acid adenylation domain-containing protein [Chitinophaga sp. CF118]|uniref:non-ribosomal peptide synthetase n=1 Tax=Chitinophaga sp. CF118 TaxID=1884367 RepID=UPI0008F39580|nr:non-ribosomal peptide synthetase [Chitinophaga sp. CF118]SFE91436.1 amino acid adenylation domain-containing protein [Chitinophaga sp. CF118]
MSIKEFVSKLESAHFSLAVQDGKLLLRGDRNKLTDEQIAAIRKEDEVITYIKDNKQQLIDYIAEYKLPVAKKRSENISAIYRLSGLQEGMLFHGLYDEEVLAYTEQFTCDIREVNVDILKESWNLLLKRHSILRSSFEYEELGMPVQCVYREVTLPFEVVDYQHLNPADQQLAIEAYLRTDLSMGLNYKEPPLMRITLLQTDKDSYHMLWTYHHILLDGWSMSILLEELLQYYELLADGKTVEWKGEDLYEDYIRYVEGRNKEQEELFWQKYMNGVEEGSLLPFISSAESRTKGAGIFQEELLVLDEEISAHVEAYAKKNGLTVNTLMQGVWAFILHNYTGKKSVTYGVITSGRPEELPEVEKKAGLYINTLPLHSKLNYNTGIAEWLNDIQQGQIESRENGYTALSTIQRWTGITGDLFDSILVFENYPVSKIAASGSWKLKLDNVIIKEHTNYPLTIIVGASDKIEALFIYNEDILETQYVKRLSGHFKQVLTQIISQEEGTVGDIVLITAAEKEQLLHSFNDTFIKADENQTIITMFEQQVQQTPSAIALVFGEEKLTYKQLDERSNQFGHYLKNQGVQHEMLVPVCMERSPEMIIAILGVLKAGAAYVPIDPDYPAERIHFMLSESNSPVIITTTAYSGQLHSTLKYICTDKLVTLLQQEPLTPVNTVLHSGNLAYIIYTSGSTGQPKGVMVTHENVVSLVNGVNYVSFNTSNILLSTGSPSFDATTFEYWGMLLNGGQLVLCEEQTLLDPALLKREIQQRGISMMWFTAGWFNQLVDTDIHVFKSLSVVLAGGEKLSAKHVNKLLEEYPSIKIINGYGPTENTTFSLTYPVKTGLFNDNIPIGYPLSNRQAYIVDELQHLVPVGVVGEIYLGGAGVARGYLNRPDLTAEKFVANPFGSERLYKTGDLGKWLPDGTIAYTGRIDEQVKIRGFRIELGEIESVLQQCEWVSQAVVTALPDANGQKRLIGYVVPGSTFDREGVMNFLKEKLPAYMIPVLLIELAQLPLTVNGKVDKKKLPLPETDTLLINEYVAPRNQTEQSLALILQRILKIERIGVYDNFFELGVHSLMVIRLIAAIREEMAVELTVKSLFTYVTIASLAEYIVQEGNKVLLPAITQQPRPAKIPLSFSQERLWFIDQLEGSLHYHMPAALRLRGKVSRDALQYALQRIVSRHEVLRSVIRSEDGIAWQEVMGADGWQLSEITVAGDLKTAINSFIYQPFDLSSEYMLRAGLVHLNEEEYILVLAMHHIASDGWSVNVLVKEFTELYAGGSDQLPELQIQYADYAIWQRTYVTGDVLQSQQDYWSQKLADTPPLELPLDYNRPAIQRTNGAVVNHHIDGLLTAKLKGFSHKQEVTLYMTLLSAFYVLLHRYSRQDDLCIGTPVAGRRQKEVEDLIGFFINTLALRCDLSGKPSFTELLQQVKTTLLEGYAHQDIPFEKVVEVVVKDRDRSRNPLFQVMFVLENTPDSPELVLGDLSLSGEEVELTTAKFDLNFMISETEQGIDLSIVYATDLFAQETIVRMAKHYEQLLWSAVALPSLSVDALHMLTEQEEHELIHTFSTGSATHFHKTDKTIIDLFHEQVLKYPDAVALVYEETQLTYQELNERADALGRYLKEEGVKADTLVPLCIDRSLEMMVGILGILKAGGAYVPIDPAFPKERMLFILEDTDCRICITDGSLDDKILPPLSRIKCLNIKEDWDLIKAKAQNDSSLNDSKPDSLVYVIYTSGSTGNPKGVMIAHSNLVDYIYGLQQKCCVNECRSFALVPAITTDLGNTIIYGALAAGGALHIISGERVTDAELLRVYFKEHPIDCLKIVPSHWKALCADGILLLPARLLIFGGEALQDDVIADIRLSGTACEVFNHYGPTETTIGKCMYKIDLQKEYTAVPIGTSFSDTSLYIVDPNGAIVPIGVGGELCIGGQGVARGYLNLPALTEEKFISNPFSIDPGSRLYRTGDLARWLPDGNIMFMGRIDNQVKIRGYRIEPEEIERVLLQSKLVNQAVVIARADISGNKYLTGYVVANGIFNREQIVSFLLSCLPEYMVPAVWMELEEMPLTANGKINRKKLPEPIVFQLVNVPYVEARNLIEKKLTDIWKELLGIERIGIYDNFFELGGHSLILIRLMSKIGKMGYRLQLGDLMTNKTIETQAALLAQSTLQGGVNDHIVLLNDARGDKPMFIIPGGYGMVDLYDQLVNKLDKNGPVYGLRMTGLLEGEVPLDSMEAIAAQNIQWIKEVQPEGPYRIMGHSFGAYALYEVIRQLEGMQEKVELAVMLDAPVRLSYSVNTDTLLDDAMIYLEEHKLIEEPYPDWIKEMRSAMELLPVSDRRAYLLDVVRNECKGMSKMLYLMICNSTMEYYVSGKVDATLTIVSAVEQNWNKFGFDETLGWKPYAGDIQAIVTPGNHVTMLENDYAKSLAVFLNKYINAV